MINCNLKNTVKKVSKKTLNEIMRLETCILTNVCCKK